MLIDAQTRGVAHSRNSAATVKRAQANSIELTADDIELCNKADIILSIVPPRDAIETARRIATATWTPTYKHAERAHPLGFIDLNAISPARAREIECLFSSTNASDTRVRMLDGGIIGGPPKLKDDGTDWTTPSIPLSGLHKLADIHPSGDHLKTVLNTKHIDFNVGAASGLKMCFACLSKGFTALAVGSYTTANSLGVLEELKVELDEHSPGVRARAEKGLVSMPPKAYRWIDEMREIAATFEVDGGFNQNESPFRAIAEIYELVANATELGKEVSGGRKREQSAEDVVGLMLEGTRKRKEKTE